MKNIIFLLVLLFLASCAQRIRVPINRFQTPETIGGGLKVEYRSQNFSEGKLSFEGNKTDNALQMGTNKKQEIMMAAGISKVDLFLEIPDGSSSMLGLKIQVLGETQLAQTLGHKLALSLATGSERDDFDSTYAIDLSIDTQDYALIHGYRFSPNLLVYESLSLTNYSFRGKIHNASGLNHNKISYRASRILGLNFGLELSSLPFSLKLEYGAQRIEWENTESKLYHGFGLALGSVF